MTRRTPAAVAVTLSALVAVTAGVTGCGVHQPSGSASRPVAPRTSSSSPTRGSAPTTFVPTRAAASFARWRLPYAISRAAVTSSDGSVAHTLLAGGMLPGDSSTDQVTAVDPATGRAHPAPGLSVPVHDAAAGWYAGRPAVFGGGNSSEQSLVQVLDSAGWRSAAQLPTTRSDLSVVTTGRSSIVVGGYDGTHVPTQVLRPRAPGFAVVGRLRTGVRYAATARVGGAVYVFGGEVDHHELADVQRFDLRTGRTRIAGHLPRPLGHAVAAAVGGRVLLLGGRIDPDTQTDAVWWFDPRTGRFTRAGRLPVALSDAAIVGAGHRLWLLGGESPGVTDQVVVVRLS